MNESRWWRWIDYELRCLNWSRADLARATGISQGRIAHWKNAGPNGSKPSVENVRAVASAFGAPILGALVEAEILTSSEVRQCTTRAGGIENMTNRELMSELERRLSVAHE